MADRSRPFKLTLVGMMATGKSTAGRRLGDHYGLAVHDSDEWIESRTGRTVRDIWKSEGVQAFRDLETQALTDALEGSEPAIVVAAGGVVLSETNRRLLRDSFPVVWLRADVATILARLADDADGAGGGHRPLLGSEPSRTLPTLDAQRRPLYAEVADIVVDVDGLTPEETVERIVAAVDGAGRNRNARPR